MLEFAKQPQNEFCSVVKVRIRSLEKSNIDYFQARMFERKISLNYGMFVFIKEKLGLPFVTSFATAQLETRQILSFSR